MNLWGGGYSVENQIDRQKIVLELAMKDGGWINNFTHWHNVFAEHKEKDFEMYLDMLADMNNNGDIHFCSYGEAISYSAYYSLGKDLNWYETKDEKGRVHYFIHLNLLPDDDINPQLLQVPISVRIMLDYKCEYKCNYPSYSVENEVIVEVPYSQSPIIHIIEE